jgi:hypothetical protein
MTLVLLAIAYPGFRFQCERRPSRPGHVWVAWRKDSRQPGVHTVITEHLDELIAALGDSPFWKFPNLQRLVRTDTA